MTNQHTPAEPVFVYADGTPIQEPPPSHWEAYQATGRTTLERLHDSDWERRQRLQTAYGPSALVVIAYGKPTQQGSKNVNRKTGAVYETANDDLVPWREAVKYACMDQRPDTIRRPTPVHMAFTVTKRRPDNHWGTGRNAGILKPWAIDTEPGVMPDGDKYQRAIWDALTWGGAWEDDAQVTRWTGAKAYATPDSSDLFVLDRPGAVIVLWPKMGAG